MIKPSRPWPEPGTVDDHGPLTRQVAEYDRWVYRLAQHPDGGSGSQAVKIGRVALAWHWRSGKVGRARGRWLFVVKWQARRDLKRQLRASHT